MTDLKEIIYLANQTIQREVNEYLKNAKPENLITTLPLSETNRVIIEKDTAKVGTLHLTEVCELDEDTFRITLVVTSVNTGYKKTLYISFKTREDFIAVIKSKEFTECIQECVDIHFKHLGDSPIRKFNYACLQSFK